MKMPIFAPMRDTKVIIASGLFDKIQNRQFGVENEKNGAFLLRM